jgi:hypothetical protein
MIDSPTFSKVEQGIEGDNKETAAIVLSNKRNSRIF